MSKLSQWLEKIGVPKEALDSIQGMIDGLTGEAKKRAQDIGVAIRGELGKLLPTAEALAASVKGQTAFKRAYRALSPEQQAGVDQTLLAICECALVKVRKALGLT